jgi:transcriptional regulator with PAS, ATPase and Fis domain
MRGKWRFLLMQAKNKSNAVEDNFTALPDLIGDPLVIIDNTGKLLVANLSVKEATSFNLKKLVGKSFLDIGNRAKRAE